MARFFKIYGHLGRHSGPAPRRVGATRRHQRRHVGITTGVAPYRLRGVDGGHAGYDVTWPATQVGRRGVEAGLGGHDDGVSRVDEGSKLIAPIIKLGRQAESDLHAFSRLTVLSK